jgi:hypothetical protein
MNFEAKNTRVEQVGDATVLCEQQLKDQRARVQAAAKAAEFSPGSLAGGSLTEQRNMVRARLQECQRLGGWLPGVSGCARCDLPRKEH